ncbi:MAG: DUF4197 domain-containing protein [Deltaproteobacteria bacterium]|nr:DUF4197 domain-containing protein [Deltaproteobacteria bacterium]
MRRIWVVMSLLVWIGLASASPAFPQWGDVLKGLQKSLGGQSFSEDEIVRGLKEALEVGTAKAVESVSKVDGYYGNSQIKIPLPESVQKVESLLRSAGLGSKIDEFELSMNRAAERAAPEAKALFWDGIKSMSFSDAGKILNGRSNEATLYFQEKTSPRLREIAKPIMHDAMSEVGVTRAYQDLDKKLRTIPLAGSHSLDLDQYVTDKALGGLFLMLAEEEKKIRENPAARSTDLLKKVFGNR